MAADATGIRNYAGAAVQSALTAGIDNSAVSFNITLSTKWPTANFVITVDPSTASEEKMLCASLAAGLVTVTTRGYDGTTAVSHASGAVVIHSISAIDIAEANYIANVHNQVSKVVPVGADEIPVFDSGATFGLKKSTLTNLWTAEASLAQTLTNKDLTSFTNKGSNTLGLGAVSTNLAVSADLSALSSNTTGANNVAVGQNALRFNTNGIQNTALGISALTSNTTGNYNTAIGTNSLQLNTIGAQNSAVGTSALQNNTTGNYNTAVGVNALQSNTTGNLNTAVGQGSLYLNTTGVQNTAIGQNALYTNTTGANNTALGQNSLFSNTIGIQNTAIGQLALYANTTGTNNTAVGQNSLQLNTTGIQNTSLGQNALNANTTGINNTAVGQTALISNTIGTNNTAIGQSALYSNLTGAQNTAVGQAALQTNTTGVANTALGQAALNANATGIQNTAVGANSLQSNTIGVQNTAVGQAALNANTTGYYNTAVGQAALQANTTGNYNTAVGQAALQLNTIGTQNTAVGVSALSANTIGTQNTAVGQNALSANTTGTQNTAVGQVALQNNTTGTLNTALGQASLNANTTGAYNTAVGVNAGFSNLTGSSNVFLGNSAGYSETGSNKLYIANTNTATPLIGGDFSAGTLILANSTTIDSNGVLGLKGLTSGTTQIKSGAIAGASVLTLPVATDTLVGRATTDVLTNKDLTSVTNTFPTSLATLTGAQTITGKTMAWGSNTFTGFPAGFTAPTIGSTVLNSGATVASISGLTLVTPVLTAPIETVNIVGAAPTATQNIDLITSAVWYFTTNAANNFVLNFRGSAGTALNTLIAIGQSITVAVRVSNAATTYYMTSLTIDSGANTPFWAGGTAPTTGDASAKDLYTFVILKTANATFDVTASMTKVA